VTTATGTRRAVRPLSGSRVREAPASAGSRLVGPSLVLALLAAWLVWIGISSLDRQGQLWSGLSAGRAELVAPVLIGLILVTVVCERCWPAERRKVLSRGHLHDGAFLLLHVTTVVPLMTLLSVAFAVLLSSHAGWITIPGTGSVPRWLLLVLTVVLMDACNWAAHWADHRFAPLWRMHALHHSQEELSVLTAFRAHPLSHLPGFFLAAIPVLALMGGRGVAPALITGYVCLGTLPHANLRWTFGPLGRIVVSPAYHRLHHAADGSEGANLGVVLTVWDVLAGRARFPTSGDPSVATGLAGRPVPTEQAGDRWHPGMVLRQLAEPFVAVPPTADRRGPFGVAPQPLEGQALATVTGEVVDRSAAPARAG
jgi:sterol desaturase/sphingolipid hydroxylase (fatty acid hydroxylase superfamily)